MVSNRADLNIIKFVDHLITSVVKLVTIKFLDIEVEPTNQLRSPGDIDWDPHEFLSRSQFS